MFNKNLIIDISTTKSNSLSLSKHDNFFIIDNAKINLKKQIRISLDENKVVNIYMYIFCQSTNKKYSFSCKHSQNSQCNIFVKILANNGGNVNIDVENIVGQKTLNCKINQDIQGIIFDKDSNIKIKPSMLIDTNKIIATHSVNIGNLNPEALFYLTSRGLSKSEASTKLIQSMFNRLNDDSSNELLKTYNKMITRASEFTSI